MELGDDGRLLWVDLRKPRERTKCVATMRCRATLNRPQPTLHALREELQCAAVARASLPACFQRRFPALPRDQSQTLTPPFAQPPRPSPAETAKSSLRQARSPDRRHRPPFPQMRCSCSSQTPWLPSIVHPSFFPLSLSPSSNACVFSISRRGGSWIYAKPEGEIRERGRFSPCSQ